MEVHTTVDEQPFEVLRYTEEELNMVCKTVWGEAGACSPEEQALVAWCICNRADYLGQTIKQVVTTPYQYHGYQEYHPVDEQVRVVVEEVLQSWSRGEDALILPPYATTSGYMYFYGDGVHNWFREVY